MEGAEAIPEQGEGLCTVAVLGREGCHRGDAVVAVLSRVPPREITLGEQRSLPAKNQKQPQILLLTGLCHTPSWQITLWWQFMLVKRDQPPEVVPSSLFKQINVWIFRSSKILVSQGRWAEPAPPEGTFTTPQKLSFSTPSVSQDTLTQWLSETPPEDSPAWMG